MRAHLFEIAQHFYIELAAEASCGDDDIGDNLYATRRLKNIMKKTGLNKI